MPEELAEGVPNPVGKEKADGKDDGPGRRRHPPESHTAARRWEPEPRCEPTAVVLLVADGNPPQAAFVFVGQLLKVVGKVVLIDDRGMCIHCVVSISSRGNR